MTEQPRPPDPTAAPEPWPAPGVYPTAPPTAWPNGDGYLPPPPSGPPPYGSGPVPTGAFALAIAHPWTPPPSAGAPGPFWPTSPEWMGLDPDRPARWGLPDVLLGILSFVVGSFLVGGGVALIGAASTGQAALTFARENTGLLGITGLAGSWGATIGFLALISHLKGQGRLRLDFGFSFTWWDPLIGAGAAIVTLLLSGVTQVFISAVTGSEPATNADAIFGNVMDNKPLLLVMALMAAVGAPLVEELLFRGLALRAIEKRFGGIAAVVGSSTLFGLLHYQPDTPALLPLIAGIAVYGVVFAVMTRWWRRLGPAVFTHIWVNSLATAVVLLPALTQ
jgi:membrane protease YdiL (CAAX protease family)